MNKKKHTKQTPERATEEGPKSQGGNITWKDFRTYTLTDLFPVFASSNDWYSVSKFAVPKWEDGITISSKFASVLKVIRCHPDLG